jgi:hypothetical protein
MQGFRHLAWSESETAHIRPCSSVINLRTFQINLLLPPSWLLIVSLQPGVREFLYTLWILKLGKWRAIHTMLPDSPRTTPWKKKVRFWRMWRRTVHSKQHGVRPQSSSAYCYTTMNKARIFINEPLVSTTQYSDQTVDRASGDSGSITGRSERFFWSVKRPGLTLRPTQRLLQRIPKAHRPVVNMTTFL